MKFVVFCICKRHSLSRPVWGAWIEMDDMFRNDKYPQSRAPYGARGLKFNHIVYLLKLVAVAPRMGRVD